MSLRRIYSDQRLTPGATASLRGDAANHVLRVLRLRRGDRLLVFDGSGTDFEAEITELRRDQVQLQLGSGHAADVESPLAVTLFQGVSRGPRMDTVIQKATELGVARIQPVLAARSVVRLDEAGAGRKREHWQRVAVAAAEQSGRSRVPMVAEPGPLEILVPASVDHATRLQLDPTGESINALGPVTGPVALLIGPEGGLTEAEVRLAADFGYRRLRLGPRILRTETAPLAALAVLQFVAGDLG
ncbi:MAG: 16S rRNA (uracil(1498)-N(3))-methyltransferase [Gammaproteobacteria bacterium]|nr:16S rRNA (uracil(1498)-N(3))-methyltransferase [Gammaproteobacteria bacterium]